MSRYRIRTPVAGHTGLVGTVAFTDGTAEIDDDRHAAELAYFRQAGYVVEPLDAEPAPDAEPEAPAATEAPAAPPGNASAEVWRDYVLTIGAGQVTEDQANDLGRDQLRELAGRLTSKEDTK